MTRRYDHDLAAIGGVMGGCGAAVSDGAALPDVDVALVRGYLSEDNVALGPGYDRFPAYAAAT